VKENKKSRGVSSGIFLRGLRREIFPKDGVFPRPCFFINEPEKIFEEGGNYFGHGTEPAQSFS
jgi:hypothetical protein